MKNFVRLYKVEVQSVVDELKGIDHFDQVNWPQAKKIANVEAIEKLLYSKEMVKQATESGRNLDAMLEVDLEDYSLEELKVEV